MFVSQSSRQDILSRLTDFFRFLKRNKNNKSSWKLIPTYFLWTYFSSIPQNHQACWINNTKKKTQLPSLAKHPQN